MKSKFVLTEEESKRILSLHKERIKEERQEVQEVDPTWNLGYTALAAGEGAAIGAMTFGPIGAVVGAIGGGIYGYLGTASGNNYEIAKKTLKMCRTEKKTFTQPKKSQQRLMAIAGDIRKALSGYGWTNLEDLQRAIASCDNIVDFCYMSYIYNDINAETLWNALDGDIDDDREWGEYVVKPLKRLQKNTKVINPKKTDELKKNAQKCGYSSVDEYKKANWKCPKGGGKKQLTDQEKMDKAEKCGHSSWNEYKNSGWKCKTDDGGGGTNTGGGGSNNTGRGGGNQIYPFDYDTILKAFPEEEIINPFEQGDEVEVQSTIVTDEMFPKF